MAVKELGRLKGLVPATFTPLSPNGELNLELIPEYVKHLASNGIEYIFINGTTGEGPSFTVEERKKLAEVWLECSKNVLKGVMVHVGAGNSSEACDLAGHAEKFGAVAISSAPSTYFKPSSTKDLVSYCRVIAAAAPSIPFYYYHIPGLTGVHEPMDEFYALAIKDIPSFRGIKYSSIDVVTLGSCLKIRKNYPQHEIFWGTDEAIIIAIDHGMECAIGSTYNMMAPIGRLIMELQRMGDRDGMMEWLFFVQDLIKAYKELAKDSSFIGVMKAITSLVTGLEMGPVRPPLASASDQPTLSKAVENLGIIGKIEEAKKKLIAMNIT